MTDTDDVDKKKIKIEDASDEISSQQNQQPTAHGQESPQNRTSQENQQRELITTENAQNLSLSSENDPIATASLPTTVITTQRHRMITTTGQIR